jgi:hypothetical protein
MFAEVVAIARLAPFWFELRRHQVWSKGKVKLFLPL